MKTLYHFGISQEDALTEFKALNLQDGDSLLCISSAGEIPLNLMALKTIHVVACDILPAQIYLSKLKFHALLTLEPSEAACFLGFVSTTPSLRLKYFAKLASQLDPLESEFWQQNLEAIEYGPIKAARFEKYVSYLRKIGTLLIGAQNLRTLVEMDDITLQKKFFEHHIDRPRLRRLFKIAFHPKIYGRRGITTRALKYKNNLDGADFFYRRFKNFCTATPARKNYYLQFTFFNCILYPEGFPEYLTETGMTRIRNQAPYISWQQLPVQEVLERNPNNAFNKIHLSNISDWMEPSDFHEFLEKIHRKVSPTSRLAIRYIYKYPEISPCLTTAINIHRQEGEKLMLHDRYPFYNLIPVEFTK